MDSSAKYEVPPSGLLVREAPGAPKTDHALVILLGCPPQCYLMSQHSHCNHVVIASVFSHTEPIQDWACYLPVGYQARAQTVLLLSAKLLAAGGFWRGNSYYLYL